MKLIAELQRRNVIRVAIAYIVGAWLLLQITEVLQGLLELPGIIGKTVILLLAIGFVPALVLAWVFELTPDGLKRESEIDAERSIAPRTGRRLNVVIIVMLAIIAGYFFWEARLNPPAAVHADSPVADAALPAAVPVSESSIAVLPFLNISANPEHVFFADGLSEEILNRLAQVPQLRVIGRSSSFAFRDETRDPRAIADTLGVTHILEGSVRRQADQIRVTAQLVAATDGTQLWSQAFDRRVDDVFVIQDEIAERVVNALDIVLDGSSRQAMLTAGVRDVDAFVAYQRGYRMVIDAHDGDAFDGCDQRLAEAEVFLDKAIAAAPDFAAAYVAKGDRYGHLVLGDRAAQTSPEERQQALDTLRELYRMAAESVRFASRRNVIEAERLFFSDNWSRLPAVLDAVLSSDA